MEQRLDGGGLQTAKIHQIWQQLRQIPDPEVPVLSITDLGMIRQVRAREEGWTVVFTPTYSGCPATEYLIDQIKNVLTGHGFRNVEVEICLHPAWTTDWMTEDGKRRLREFGIAPPQGCACDPYREQAILCPRCGASASEKLSEFGSTACKALYRCTACRETFDYFKCI